MSGHPLRMTAANERKHIRPKPVLPGTADMPILRRAAQGYIVVTMIDGARQFNYEDGSHVSLKRSKLSPTRWDEGEKHFDKLVKEGWLVGDKGDCLFADDPHPQIYRTRKAV